ncbi:RyR domain-containing protein [Nonomuraea sp. M3C6]|uniref:RyR domain-containing protein n=1 Tax=Nonomuraea marmarensis TaxID=3351344 RepID=A0ABW7APB7_9ACTN
MALTISSLPAVLALRVGAQETTLATFDLPLKAEATGDPGVTNLALDVPEFRSLLAAVLREAAAVIEQFPDDDPHAPEDPSMKVYATTIARVCHEANRVLQIAAGDPAPSPHWADAPAWQRESAIKGVEAALSGATPQELHESWCEVKRAGGWTYGPVKDEAAKTHPCLVPYGDLPDAERVKDHLFHAIVRAFPAARTEG